MNSFPTYNTSDLLSPNPECRRALLLWIKRNVAFVAQRENFIDMAAGHMDENDKLIAMFILVVEQWWKERRQAIDELMQAPRRFPWRGDASLDGQPGDMSIPEDLKPTAEEIKLIEHYESLQEAKLHYIPARVCFGTNCPRCRVEIIFPDEIDESSLPITTACWNCQQSISLKEVLK